MNISKLLKWYSFSKRELSIDNIKDEILNLGKWIRNRRYIGVDLDISNAPKEISTVYGFSLVGWINLYNLFKSRKYLKEADYCLEKILSMQTTEGGWLFPYRFRNNPPNFPYACENFMTIESLFQYYKHVKQKKSILKSIEKAILFLVEHIGYEEGIFWYSSTDKINVPNISSMAANVFAKAYLMLNDTSYLEKAKTFANYCIINQTKEGAFPYFEGEDLVYIPYHALETWELKEANEVLKNKKIEKSVRSAMGYLTKHFKNSHYSSFNIHKNLSSILFKTPLWGAKTYLMYGDYEKAFSHFKNSLLLFRVPNKPYYLYFIRKLTIAQFNLYYPIINSVFMRYNASCFEVGSSLLLRFFKSAEYDSKNVRKLYGTFRGSIQFKGIEKQGRRSYNYPPSLCFREGTRKPGIGGKVLETGALGQANYCKNNK